MGWCSWCIEPAQHSIEEAILLGRNTYSCEKCGGSTTACLVCKIAMARVGDTWNDPSCEICSIPKSIFETVQTTYSEKIAPMLPQSPPVPPKVPDRASKPKLTSSGPSSQNIGRIDPTAASTTDPSTRTSDVTTPSVHATPIPAITSPLTPPIPFPTSSSTPATGNEEVERQMWLRLNQRKKDMYDRAFTTEDALNEMASSSPEKENAMKVGLIRPFLLLVSMHPAMRCQIGMLLGWCGITRPSYGKPHQEAWEILTSELKGMVARANELTQNINPLSKNCSYYDIVRKVTLEIFHACSSPELAHTQSLLVSITPNDSRMHKAEEEFLENVAEARKKSMTEEERAHYIACFKNVSSEFAQANTSVLERLEIKNEAAREYCKELIEKVLDKPKEVLTDMTKDFLRSHHLLAASTVGAKFSMPLPFVVAKLVYTGAQIVFGPSLAKLYGPMVCLLAQRVLLASQQIEVDQYYK